jgi:ornithine decarboxylase
LVKIGVINYLNAYYINLNVETQKALEKYFPTENFPKLSIIAEPGRFLCESALTLCSQIIAKNTINESVNLLNVNNDDECDEDYKKLNIDNSKSFMYYLNCGFYSGLMYMDKRNLPEHLNLFNNGNKLISYQQQKQQKKFYLTTLWGPTCDALDIVVKRKFLPEYQIDDFLVFNDMGAYTNTIITQFNSFKVPTFIYAAFAYFDQYKEAFSKESNK